MDLPQAEGEDHRPAHQGRRPVEVVEVAEVAEEAEAAGVAGHFHFPEVHCPNQPKSS